MQGVKKGRNRRRNRTRERRMEGRCKEGRRERRKDRSGRGWREAVERREGWEGKLYEKGNELSKW